MLIIWNWAFEYLSIEYLSNPSSRHKQKSAIPPGASSRSVSSVCYIFLKTALKSEPSRWTAAVLDGAHTACIIICTTHCVFYNTLTVSVFVCYNTLTVSALCTVQSLHIHSASGLAAYSRLHYTCSQQEQLFHNLLLIMMMIPTTTMITIYVARNTDLRYLRVLRTSEHCSFDISVVTGECRNCTIYEFAFDNWILGFLWNVDQ